MMQPSTLPQNHSAPGTNTLQLVGGTPLRIQPKTRSELATEMGVHANTITDWCKRAGIKHRRRISVNEMIMFYNHHGWPGEYQLVMNISPPKGSV